MVSAFFSWIRFSKKTYSNPVACQLSWGKHVLKQLSKVQMTFARQTRKGYEVRARRWPCRADMLEGVLCIAGSKDLTMIEDGGRGRAGMLRGKGNIAHFGL